MRGRRRKCGLIVRSGSDGLVIGASRLTGPLRLRPGFSVIIRIGHDAAGARKLGLKNPAGTGQFARWLLVIDKSNRIERGYPFNRTRPVLPEISGGRRTIVKGHSKLVQVSREEGDATRVPVRELRVRMQVLAAGGRRRAVDIPINPDRGFARGVGSLDIARIGRVVLISGGDPEIGRASCRERG